MHKTRTPGIQPAIRKAKQCARELKKLKLNGLT